MSCCSASSVDWMQPGGLMRCDSCCISFNWPCCPIIVSGSWHENKRAGKLNIVYPLNEAMPMFLVAVPISGCILCCVDPGASALIVTYDNDSLEICAELRRKTKCNEQVELRRTLVTKAYVEDKPGGMFTSRTARYFCSTFHRYFCL
jgi:hypothetical protein